MKILSIIIPVYNVEVYIRRCLDSVLNQDIDPDKFEVIIINDGTEDDSLKIAEEVTTGHKNVFIHSQENAGLSAARNKGMALSSGEYIWFIDSDDWIKRNCLKEILAEIQGNDVLAMGYIEAYDDVKKNKEVNYSTAAKTGSELLLQNFFPQAQLYVFRRAFLLENKLSFYKGIFHEDAEFTPRMLYYAGALKILKESVYYFYKRPNSISTTPNPKRVFDLITVAISLNEFKQNKEKKIQVVLNNKISLALNNALFLTYKMDDSRIREINQAFYKSRYLCTCLRGSNIKKYRLEAFLFEIFPKKMVQTYQLMQRLNPNTPKDMKLN